MNRHKSYTGDIKVPLRRAKRGAPQRDSSLNRNDGISGPESPVSGPGGSALGSVRQIVILLGFHAGIQQFIRQKACIAPDRILDLVGAAILRQSDLIGSHRQRRKR